jgi:hypothetical protein
MKTLLLFCMFCVGAMGQCVVGPGSEMGDAACPKHLEIKKGTEGAGTFDPNSVALSLKIKQLESDVEKLKAQNEMLQQMILIVARSHFSQYDNKSPLQFRDFNNNPTECTVLTSYPSKIVCKPKEKPLLKSSEGVE